MIEKKKKKKKKKKSFFFFFFFFLKAIKFTESAAFCRVGRVTGNNIMAKMGEKSCVANYFLSFSPILMKFGKFLLGPVSARSLFSAAVAGRPAVNSREQLRRPHTLILSWTNLLCLTEQQISEQLISDVRYRFCMYWNRTELSELSELNITCVWTCNSRTQVLDTFMLMKTGYKCLVLEIW